MLIICTKEEYGVFQREDMEAKISELKDHIVSMGISDVQFRITESSPEAELSIANWLNEAVGKSFNLDGKHGAQCKDLVDAYALWLGHPLEPSDAADMWDKDQGEFWKRIPYQAGMQGELGDIVVWGGWAGNDLGHTAVVIESNAKEFKSLDQNWNSNDLKSGSPAEIITHSYDSPKIAGFFRPQL